MSALAAIGFGLIVFTRPPAPRGNFPKGFAVPDKRQIVAAANTDALRQTVKALGHGRLSEAYRWMMNSRKQTVREVGNQSDGKVWVTFGFDEATAAQGYAIWARYIMRQDKGRWVIELGPF